jgi:ABC-type amino acid transport substrate-binding protein
MGETSRRVWPVRRREAGPDEAVPLPDEPPPPAAAPADEPEPAPRLGLAAARLAALGLALVLAIVIAFVRLFVGGPPSVAELRAQAGVEGWPELRVGVKDDQYGTAYYDDTKRTWSGFDIDIAYMIAEDLGFRRSEVRFYGMESEDRARMQATVGDRRVPVHMVIASYSITPERDAMAGVRFSAPYLYTEQSVLALAGGDRISALEDLTGRRVCTLSTATSATALERAKAIVSRKNRIKDCVKDLRDGKVDAVSTDAAILAGYKATFPGEFDHWDLGLDTTEAWGVNVGENPALKTLVDLTLYRSLKDPRDDRWEEAYEKNLQSEVPLNPGTPIAQSQQPDVPKPDVREQPWEEVF